nr:MAG TPA: hypothetical protein [Caudoviricetes sp.]
MYLPGVLGVDTTTSLNLSNLNTSQTKEPYCLHLTRWTT